MAKKPASKSVAKSGSKKPVAKPAATKKVAVKAVAKKVVAKKPVVKAAASKAPPAKAAPAKSTPAAKSVAPVKATPKAAAAPSVMSKKGRAAVEVEDTIEIEDKVPAKAQTIVSLIETDESTTEPAKAEKVSKVKPIKVDRGNLADEKAKWAELNRKLGKDKSLTYKMSEKYEAMIPLQHKVLGWGFILSNENDRLEVLFETGIRILISNYKS